MLQSKYQVSTLGYESYAERPFLHKVVSNLLGKILQYRFSEIHQFKKHILKKKCTKLSQTDFYGAAETRYGFPFSKSKFLFKLFYYFHLNLKSFFKFKEKPDLVVITGCQEGFSQYILNWANKNNILSICLVNSWDHLTFRGPSYCYPNIKKYLVWGEVQKEELIKYHSIDEKLITITGSPQFDFLFDLKKSTSLRKDIGLNDDDFVVFFPTYNERHGYNEPSACEKMINILNSFKISYKIVLRPYPKDTTFKLRFKKFLDKPNIIISEIDNDFISDRKKISLLLKHCNMVVCGPGTVAIEAMYFHKPIIFLAMETRTNFSNLHIATERYYTDHLINVIIPGGSYFCDDFQQLEGYFKNIIDGTANFEETQDKILKQQIFTLQGNASDLILEEIRKILV